MQLDAMVDLTRSFSPEQFNRALESWDWIGIGDRRPVFTSPFGDVFFQTRHGFWWFDTLSVSNIQVIDFVVSVNVLGQLHRQGRDLPPGAQISEFRLDS